MPFSTVHSRDMRYDMRVNMCSLSYVGCRISGLRFLMQKHLELSFHLASTDGLCSLVLFWSFSYFKTKYFAFSCHLQCFLHLSKCLSAFFKNRTSCINFPTGWIYLSENLFHLFCRRRKYLQRGEFGYHVLTTPPIQMSTSSAEVFQCSNRSSLVRI